MKLNPFGFNLNFDEFLVWRAPEGRAFGVLALPDVDAFKVRSGMAFGETRRPGLLRV
jgi:hypothetical protein